MNESGTSIQQKNDIIRVTSNDDNTSLQEATRINTSTYGEGFGSPRKRGGGLPLLSLYRETFQKY